MSNLSAEIEILEYRDGKLAYYMEQRQALRWKVYTALCWLSLGLAEQGWSNIKKPSELVDHVLDEFELLLVGGTLIAFSVGEPWFMDGLVLDEEFIAPISDSPAPIKLVVEALEAAGAAAGCKLISLGTRANPRQGGLARLFEQAGCKRATTGFVKEIPNG